MNWDQITEELEKPLDKKHVKPPPRGKFGEYIEGWRAIDEANRIFGFGGWSRETFRLEETNRDLGNDKWRVGYLCQVKITVDGVVRIGTGFGTGIAKKDCLGDAIESAAKEAETDATKRALMTFGNPFGLALYDNEKANVVDVEAEEAAAQTHAKRVQKVVDVIATIGGMEEFRAFWEVLSREEPEIAGDKAVFDAKEERKADLLRAQRDAK